MASQSRQQNTLQLSLCCGWASQVRQRPPTGKGNASSACWLERWDLLEIPSQTELEITVLANNWALRSPAKQIHKINILSPCFTLPEGMAVGGKIRKALEAFPSLLSPEGHHVSTSFSLRCLPFLVYRNLLWPPFILSNAARAVLLQVWL